MGKPTICIGKNKGADQLLSNCEADQRLCFRYTDSTIPLLSKSRISSLYPSSVTVQPSLCQTWSEPQIVDFLMHGLISNDICDHGEIHKDHFQHFSVNLWSTELNYTWPDPVT